MLRRVLKSKQADRALWVTLFLLTLFGVGVALKLSLNAEKRARWIGAGPPDSDLEDNPLRRTRPPSRLTPRPACGRVQRLDARRFTEARRNPQEAGDAGASGPGGSAVDHPARPQGRRDDPGLPQRNRNARPVARRPRRAPLARVPGRWRPSDGGTTLYVCQTYYRRVGALRELQHDSPLSSRAAVGSRG